MRKARYAFDESQLRPYFELDHVLLDGVLYAATRLYGITFKERHDLPPQHPDARIFEVFNADGSSLALFMSDPYARPSKRGGAWMHEYVIQNELLGKKPVVALQLNIPKPAAGEPCLLTYDEVTVAFHEFGHVLHGMFSQVKYPRFGGTNVPRDFVEFPSQVNEMWATWPEVLNHYAKHYKTGEPMPPALLKKIQATQQFNQGFATTAYIAAAALDQAWHQLGPTKSQPTRSLSKPTRSRKPEWISRLSRRVIAPLIFPTPSTTTATPPGITHTFGAKSSMPIRSNGSSNTAA